MHTAKNWFTKPRPKNSWYSELVARNMATQFLQGSAPELVVDLKPLLAMDTLP